MPGYAAGGVDSDAGQSLDVHEEEGSEDYAVPKLACCRKSPRPCVNQSLVNELAVLRKERFLEYGSQKYEAISYARACSVIIGCPFKITSKAQALSLPSVSEKIAEKIEEFLDKGYMSEARRARDSQRLKVLSELATVHGIGHSNARDLYDSGVRSLEHLARFGKYSLRYHADLQLKISRAEVENIRDFVQIQLDHIEPGAITEICGGYRRGKEWSNDVDILITYPHQKDKEKRKLKALLHRLIHKGIVPKEDGVIYEVYTGTERMGKNVKSASQMDSLDRAFVIFVQPADARNRPRPIARRVDLIMVPWSSWGSAVVGWTGSTQFERAALKVICVDEPNSWGFHNATTDEPYECLTERDVFRILQLEYIEPHLRNADP